MRANVKFVPLDLTSKPIYELADGIKVKPDQGLFGWAFPVDKERFSMVVPAQSASAITNLRDFGGQNLGLGARVRRGILYRSGSLSSLIPDHHVMLDSLGIRAVVDLRSVLERDRHPCEWSASGARLVHSAITDTNAMLREIFTGNFSDADICHGLFSEFYARIPELYAAEFSQMFALMAQSQVPMLINCSAGKDRTGVAAALILTMLGVTETEIFEDYMATQNRLRDNPAFMQMLSGKIIQSYAALPVAAQNVLMGVHPDHLKSAFAQIDAQYGGVSAYLENRLSISAEAQMQIRRNLTEQT